METKKNGNEQSGAFSAEKFTEYLKEVYSAIRGEYKPLVALQLKTYLTIQEKAIRQYMNIQERNQYDEILLDFEKRFGTVNTYLNECIGKTVQYAFTFGFSGVGVIRRFIFNKDEVEPMERIFFQSGIGVELFTCNELIPVRSESVHSMSLVSEQ